MIFTRDLGFQVIIILYLCLTKIMIDLKFNHN